jgi:hypothetical protein
VARDEPQVSVGGLLEQEILGFNIENKVTRWTKGSSAHQKIRRDQHARRQRKQHTRKEGRTTKSESKEGLDRRPTTWKVVKKWASGFHLELEFLSHNVRGFTHFVI